jgi:hypothetical protein
MTLQPQLERREFSAFTLTNISESHTVFSTIFAAKTLLKVGCGRLRELAHATRQAHLSACRRHPNIIRLLGATNEKIRRLKAEDLVDERFVRKLEKERRF